MVNKIIIGGKTEPNSTVNPNPIWKSEDGRTYIHCYDNNAGYIIYSKTFNNTLCVVKGCVDYSDLRRKLEINKYEDIRQFVYLLYIRNMSSLDLITAIIRSEDQINI